MKSCGRFQSLKRGLVCSTCKEKCVICSSTNLSNIKANLCDTCGKAQFFSRCMKCGKPGTISNEGFYCKICVFLHRDTMGCPRFFEDFC